MYPSIQTDRLLLRGFTTDDAADVRILAGAPEIARTTLNIPHPYEVGMAESWIQSHQRAYAEGAGIIFAICKQGKGQLLGAIGLTIQSVYRRAELGYWIALDSWGKGYATEAARAVVNFGFVKLKLNKIYATHMRQNTASGRIMQKIGMQQEGLLRQHVQKDGNYIDLVLYSILASEWISSDE